MNKHEKDKIMLIDTDSNVTNDLAERLSNTGFDILTANNEETALKLLHVTKPSVILLDMLMKGKDEKDILTSLKSNGILANIPVIVLSSKNDANLIVYGFLQGASDYVAKPFVFPEILARINNQIKLTNIQKELELKNNELIRKNTLLEQMAITDSLTGLYNKGYMLKRLENEIIRAARYHEFTSLIIMDIDNFKEVNDTYGHLSGDKLLKDISKLISSLVRDVDITARYGGDEFFVICPNTDLNGAKILADRIRSRVENHKFKLEQSSTTATLSMGISNTDPSHITLVENDLKKLINEADIALYHAKSKGRNRVEIYSYNVNNSEIINNDSFRNIPDNTNTTINKYTH